MGKSTAGLMNLPARLNMASDTERNDITRIGISEVIRLFGEKAGRAARRHILTDIEEEGWPAGTHLFPQNEKHYVEMGLY